MLKQFNKHWFSPTYTRECVIEYAKIVGYDKIENDKKFQKINEARQASLVALVVNAYRNLDHIFLRLQKDDPPDAVLMQQSPSNRGTMDILEIELTDYRGNKSLLEQLKERKIPEGYHVLSPNVIVVIELYTQIGVNYEDIFQYLKDNKVSFEVWTLRQYPNANKEIIAEVIRIQDKEMIQVNLSHEAFKLEQKQIPDIVVSKRAGSIEKVRFQRADIAKMKPWESLE